jgi:hypothetical protein
MDILKERWAGDSLAKIEKSKNNDYDIKVSVPSSKVTYEVKTDLLVNETGNVAVEMEKTIAGEKKKSGLSVSKADFYVYKLIRDAYFYVIATDDLRKFIAENSFREEVGGDRDDYKVVLIPKEEFCKQCVKIKRKVMAEFNSKFLKKK